MAELDDIRTGALELAAAWEIVGYHCGDPTPTTSRCAQEAAVLSAAVDEPAQLTRAIAQDAATYVTAAAQHLRSLVGLLGPDIALSGWSLTRALAEYCGRTGWLLSPNATPSGRVARFYMERIVSLHMARLSQKQLGNSDHAKELKQKREATLAQARRAFPDAVLFTDVQELNEWAVGGEPYAGLAKAVNDFGRDHLDSKGLYSMLSSFTHPSLYWLDNQTKVTQLEDRLHYAFTADPEVIQWQLAAACSAVYRAAWHLATYLDIDGSSLEEWADQNPALLGWKPAIDDEVE